MSLLKWKKFPDALHVLSLGAGRQSSVMYLMACAGEITPRPDAVIFADTGNEPPHVYEQLEYLQRVGNVPITVVSNGNIYDDSMAALKSPEESPWGENRWDGAPVFTRGGGPIKRKCTEWYKIKPQLAEFRRLLRAHNKQKIINWRGHTVNEIQRAKPSRRKYVTIRWPLLELRMSDHDCARWMERNEHPAFQWSACEICPFRLRELDKAKQLREMPDVWKRITDLDEAARDLSPFGIKKPVYFNAEYVSMEEFADMPEEKQQPSLFGCDGGACGL